MCPLAAVLVIVSVLCPGQVTPQCTSKYCHEGQEETDLWTALQRLQHSFDALQQLVTEQNEIIRSLQKEIVGTYWGVFTHLWALLIITILILPGE